MFNSYSTSSLLVLFFLAGISLIQNVLAQVGPEITNPPYNATVQAGDTVTINYEYQNMGTGNYTVDIAIWLDASATDLIQNITTNEPIAGGNSTGFQVNFTNTASYDWQVPHGLTFTNSSGDKQTLDIFYLTVTTTANTHFFNDLQLRSRPILLHYSSAVIHTPAHGVLLFVLSIAVYLLTV